MLAKITFLEGLRNELIISGYYKNPHINYKYRKEINIYKTQCNHRHLSRHEFDRLATYAQNGCEESIELTAIYSTRIIAKIVKQYKTKFTPDSYDVLDEDLMQAGFVGVIASISKWKPEKGPFTSYATYRIIKKVKQSVRTTSDLMAIKGSNWIYLTAKLPYLISEYETECESNGLPYTIDGLTDWLNNENRVPLYVNRGKPVPSNIILDLINAISIGSLDDQYGNSNTDNEIQVSIVNNIPDHTVKNPELEVIDKGMHDILKDFYSEILSVLPLSQQLILITYYNLEDDIFEKPNQIITFKKVASVLNKKYPGQKWNSKNCEALHNIAIQKIQSYITQKGIKYQDFISE